MSGTQQWPPPTPPPVVFVPPEPEPERKPAKPKEPVPMPPFGELTDDELEAARTEARRASAALAAEARRRGGRTVRRGPDRAPRKPYRDRAALAAVARQMLAKGEVPSVAGLMKSQGCGHTVAVQVMSALEAEGLMERGEDGRFHAK